MDISKAKELLDEIQKNYLAAFTDFSIPLTQGSTPVLKTFGDVIKTLHPSQVKQIAAQVGMSPEDLEQLKARYRLERGRGNVQ